MSTPNWSTHFTKLSCDGE